MNMPSVPFQETEKPIAEMHPATEPARMRVRKKPNRLRQTAGEAPTNLFCTQLEEKDTAGVETRAWIMAGDRQELLEDAGAADATHRRSTHLCRRHSSAREDSFCREDSIFGTEALAQSRESDSL